ncbi:MAG: phosphatase PAP2 family protein [Chloroflexi bacterium]|nr:phosphatase PAP2 family protein [Chloroflexota bacterium]
MMRRGVRALGSLDGRLSRWLSCRTARRPRVYGLCILLAHAGDGLICLAGALAALALRAPGPHLRPLALHLAQIALAVVLTAACVTTLKFAVRRERPFGHESAKWSALPEYDLHSFPSGHAARVACIAVGLCLFNPGNCPLAVLWALSVSYARVAVAAHYLSDVLVGVLVGAGVMVCVASVWPTVFRWLA